jgi:hypothetical protein
MGGDHPPACSRCMDAVAPAAMAICDGQHAIAIHRGSAILPTSRPETTPAAACTLGFPAVGRIPLRNVANKQATTGLDSGPATTALRESRAKGAAQSPVVARSEESCTSRGDRQDGMKRLESMQHLQQVTLFSHPLAPLRLVPNFRSIEKPGRWTFQLCRRRPGILRLRTQWSFCILMLVNC